MDHAQAVEALERQGWFVTEWTDEPLTAYPEHSHPSKEIRVVLEGSMTIIVRGAEHELGAGDRFEIAPDEPHEAIVGPDGVTYLAGRTLT